MFWKKKNPKKAKKSPADIRAQAFENARAARENIGEDTLNRIAEAMTKKQQSSIEKAKADISGADTDRVLDELKTMLDTKE